MIEKYRSDKAWTKFMVGEPGKSTPAAMEKENSFLYRLSKTLGLRMGKEWMMKMDCVYYKEAPQLISYGEYPAGIDVYIEHENGATPEQEMWKILMWRCPLKVLIFYDEAKIPELFKLGQAVDEWWPENSNTEYVLLIGKRDEEGFPGWRYLRNDVNKRTPVNNTTRTKH